MAAEGLDIPSLTTLILATPKSDIIQSVGKFYTLEDYQQMDLDKEYFMVSTDRLNLQNILDNIDKIICIDVANGYMEKLGEFCYGLESYIRQKLKKKVM